MKCPNCGRRMVRLYIRDCVNYKVRWVPLNGYYCKNCKTILLCDEQLKSIIVEGKVQCHFTFCH